MTQALGKLVEVPEENIRDEAKSLAKANIEITGSGVMSKKSALIIQSEDAKKQVQAFRASMKK